MKPPAAGSGATRACDDPAGLARWAYVALLALSLIGCSDGEEAGAEPGEPCVCDAGGGGTGGEASSDCVEYRVSVSMLPPTRTWASVSIRSTHLPVHPFWRDATGLHMVWSAYSVDPSDSERLTAHMVLTTFPGSSGATFGHAIYDVFPEGISPWVLSGAVADVAVSPDGTTAIGIGYRPSLAADPIQKILLTRLDQPEKQTVWTPPWPTSELFLWEIAWDGEAFALHFGLSNPGLQDWGIRLVRLSPDGTLLSGPDVVASSAVVQDAFSVATDPVTGTTVFAYPGGSGVSLSGHLRDGTPLFPDDPYFARAVAAQGVPPESSKFSGWPAVALDGEQVVLGWMGQNIDNDSYVQRLNGFVPETPAIVIPEPAGGMRQRVLSRTSKGWMMMGKIHAHIDAFEIEGDALAEQRPVVTHSFESCWRTDTCDTSLSPGLDARNLQLLRYQDELWFGFLDYSDSFDHDDQSDPLIGYRIVNAASKCAYPSLYDEHHPSKGGVGGS